MKFAWLVIFIVAVPLLTLINNDVLLANFGYLLSLLLIGTIISGIGFGVSKLFTKKPINYTLLLNVGACIMVILPVLFHFTKPMQKSQPASSEISKAKPTGNPRYYGIPSTKIEIPDKNGKRWLVRISFAIELNSPDDRAAIDVYKDVLASSVTEAVFEYGFEELTSANGKTELTKNVINRINQIANLPSRKNIFLSDFYYSAKQ